MPEQRHSNLSKIGVVVLKQTSQCLNMLWRFHHCNKLVQDDGHHLPMLNQHGIFKNLMKIIENYIVFLVLPLMWHYKPNPYLFLHWVMDIMPFATKMLDYPSTIIHTPMFDKT
jgi:hypothetical protein